MEKVTLRRIAEINKTSVTTVYNAINSCIPVDTKLKIDIINTAESMGYFEHNKVCTCDIAVVLPTSPTYFWSEAGCGIMDEVKNTNMSLKFFTYNNMDNEEDFILCIERAKKTNAKAYIITPIHTEKAIKALKELSGNIIFLNEYLDINNVAYVGANSYSDGQALAQACKHFLNEHPRVLLIDSNYQHQMAQLRKKGFCDSLPSNVRIVGEIKFNFNRTLAANIARLIRNSYIDKFDCIFVAQGWFQHISMALTKLNIVVPCIGCEDQKISPNYSKNGKLYCTLVQQIKLQGAASTKYAINLIEKQEEPGKHITVPSMLILNDKI